MKTLRPFERIDSVAQGQTHTPPGPEKAVEIIPVMVFSPMTTRTAVRDMRPAVAPVVEETVEPESAHAPEAEATADADPKAAILSVTDDASDSESDTSESGREAMTENELPHPSSVRAFQEDPVTAEKEQSPTADQTLQLSPGLLTPPV